MSREQVTDDGRHHERSSRCFDNNFGASELFINDERAR